MQLGVVGLAEWEATSSGAWSAMAINAWLLTGRRMP